MGSAGLYIILKTFIDYLKYILYYYILSFYLKEIYNNSYS